MRESDGASANQTYKLVFLFLAVARFFAFPQFSFRPSPVLVSGFQARCFENFFLFSFRQKKRMFEDEASFLVVSILILAPESEFVFLFSFPISNKN